MKLPEIQPSQNGYHPDRPLAGGTLAAAPQRTTFPVDSIPLSPIVVLYNLSRFTLGEISLIRCIRWILLIFAALWLSGALPGGRWVCAVWLILLVALEAWLLRWQRRDFVHFVACTCPPVQAQALDAKAKIPIHASGLFQVEAKRRRYTWLPGFYRTFATREHALLCQVVERRFFKVGHWPEAEVGLWYVFFQPEMIQQVEWGTLHFGAHSRPALAVTYEPLDQAPKRRHAPPSETIYLAFQQAEEGLAILADLLQDLPATASHASSSLSARQ